MSKRSEGGKRAAETNKRLYGEDFYTRIGKMAKPSGTRGFGSSNVGSDGLTGVERARIAGSKGGKKSRKPKGLK